MLSEPELLKLVLDEKVMEARVEALFYTPMGLAHRTGATSSKWTPPLKTKAVAQAILGKTFADCRGMGMSVR